MTEIYIAGPFFNDEQKRVIEEIENAVGDIFGDYNYFSPRKFGIVKESSEDKIQDIYDKNIEQLIECDMIIAVIDGMDPGTMFEIGYVKSMDDASESKIIVTFTNEQRGLNVMIQKAVDAHIKGIDQLKEFLYKWKNSESFSTGVLMQYRNFEKGTY